MVDDYVIDGFICQAWHIRAMMSIIFWPESRFGVSRFCIVAKHSKTKAIL